ncbi:hypothetical protein AKO1_001846 [Acrasis kona]|uniref:UBX domain-containing protein n=1 Tax=Acrasis kona TaxID=1008807 RepID=A0AAW2Z8M5_9EUKA
MDSIFFSSEGLESGLRRAERSISVLVVFLLKDDEESKKFVEAYDNNPAAKELNESACSIIALLDGCEDHSNLNKIKNEVAVPPSIHVISYKREVVLVEQSIDVDLFMNRFRSIGSVITAERREIEFRQEMSRRSQVIEDKQINNQEERKRKLQQTIERLKSNLNKPNTQSNESELNKEVHFEQVKQEQKKRASEKSHIVAQIKAEREANIQQHKNVEPESPDNSSSPYILKQQQKQKPTKQPKREFVSSKISFRVSTTGETFLHTFDASETLGHLRTWVNINVENGGQYQLFTPVPRLPIIPEMFDTSLQDFKLVPAAVIILDPIAQVRSDPLSVRVVESLKRSFEELLKFIFPSRRPKYVSPELQDRHKKQTCCTLS